MVRPIEFSIKTARSIGDAALRSVQSSRLGKFRIEHHYEDQIDILKQEKDKTAAHTDIAQMAAIRIQNLTIQHYRETKQGPEPMSEAYVEQVTSIMHECGVPHATITEMMDNPVVMPDMAQKPHQPII